MARLIDNPLGSLSGKAGSLVFKKGKYGNYVCSLPSPSTAKRTKPQQLQQSKMKAVMHFLKPARMILNKTYFPLQKNKPVFNSLKSYYLRHGVISNKNGYTIDYSRCLMSYGDLRIPEHLQLQRIGSLGVNVTWSANNDQALANKNDRLFAIVYQPDTHKFKLFDNLGFRKSKNGHFVLPEVWSSFTDFHLWIGYLCPKQENASISVYMGQL
ncbi:DUF6266 family protein [Mesonia aquimarina]|uniref:DUF6266 family protein n=1 Tax=Mesonia aquimarina TaxID=1504967 RepID=UPI000EF62FDE|nr:DUF6266 family protein [Mesonia aquimarina]